MAVPRKGTVTAAPSVRVTTRRSGERVLLCDAGAMGVLRRELIATLGTTAARGVLTRFGRFIEVVKPGLRFKLPLQ